MRLLILSMTLIVTLYGSESDWNNEQSWGIEELDQERNSEFEKAKIENRSKKVYDDKVYKYITGDYVVENNQIEIGAIHLNDRLQNEEIEVNMYTEDLRVEGNSYKDSLDIRRNQYKNYVSHDSRYEQDSEEEFDDAWDDEAYEEESGDDRRHEAEQLSSPVYYQELGYQKVEDEEISEIGEIDLRNQRDIKEVNVLIEDVNVLVD